MNPGITPPAGARDTPDPAITRARLYRKYVALLLGVVGLALIPNALVDIWFSYEEFKPLLVRIQREQAVASADKIAQFVREIESQMSWAAQLPLQDKSDDEWRLDAVRLMRQAPAVTELAQLDGLGRERYRMSRQAMDVIGSLSDFSRDPAFVEAMANGVYYGPVHFLRESEPYMTLAVAGTRRNDGVIVGQVNLKLIWDVVSQIKVGKRGEAYVVDKKGRLISHPDISLVLRHTDLSQLAHVQAVWASRPGLSNHSSVAVNFRGREVLSAIAPVRPLGWTIFADLPIEEAYAPLYATVLRSFILLLVGLALAFFAGLVLARRMVVPIRTLSEGAARIGGGDLAQRIAIKTGDELEELGEQFNRMAARLQESHATLERKVEERTRQLAIANDAKSRFLATASHDLRQPLHALGLFFARLRERTRADERKRIMVQIESALSAMNELFNALLDVSKLDHGVTVPARTEFPIANLLEKIEATFAGSAREGGLSLRVVGSSAWVNSDFVLLERIVFNLVSNAVRYTSEGGMVVGCRRRGTQLRIEVWDTGPGIPPDQRQYIFGEFYRLGGRQREARGGLGLGLAIVERLCRLLGHTIELSSVLGKGSCFSVAVPMARAQAPSSKSSSPARTRFDVSNGKLVVVIDDDSLVLEGMGGLLQSWGCNVVTGNSDGAALAGLARYARPPDVIISDYHLRSGKTGIEVIERLRAKLSAPIPGFLMSGDTKAEPLHEARAHGYPLLHKPVDAMALRATLLHVLKKREAPLTRH